MAWLNSKFYFCLLKTPFLRFSISKSLWFLMFLHNSPLVIPVSHHCHGRSYCSRMVGLNLQQSLLGVLNNAHFGNVSRLEGEGHHQEGLRTDQSSRRSLFEENSTGKNLRWESGLRWWSDLILSFSYLRFQYNFYEREWSARYFPFNSS